MIPHRRFPSPQKSGRLALNSLANFDRITQYGGRCSKSKSTSLRTTAAIQFIRNGGYIFALQNLLVHETLNMVLHYVDLASDNVATAHQQVSPVDGGGYNNKNSRLPRVFSSTVNKGRLLTSQEPVLLSLGS
jgi:hypothetical protein